MPQMTDTERLHYLAGLVASQEAMLVALMRAHPDPARLMREFSAATESLQAHTLPTRVPEPYMQGVEDSTKALLGYLRATTGP